MKNIVRIIFLIIVFFLFYYLFQQKNLNTNKLLTVTKKEVPKKDFLHEESESLRYLNHLRKRAGMTQFFINDTLGDAALNHAKYLIVNDEIGHYEIAGKLNFSGEGPGKRVLAAGYNTGMVIENISSNSVGYKDSIDGLFSAIYHRFGFLDFQVNEIGIAVFQSEKEKYKSAYVYNMGIYEINNLCQQEEFDGYGKYIYKVCRDENIKIKESLFNDALNSSRLYNKRVVIYPYDTQEEVPPAFFDEIPDPLPEHRVSGFPISIQFNDYYFERVKVTSFKLFDKNDKLVKDTIFYNHINDPNSKFKKFEFALFPLKRLEWDSKYTVIVEYIADSKKETKEWYFKTKSFKEPLVKVTPKNYIFEIEPKREYIFYFEPLSKTDILGDLQYPASLDIDFLDKNSIKIMLNDNKKKIYKLQFGLHRLELNVKKEIF